MSDRAIAVALHDVEPATFERCALIRDWLSDHGIDRATLLVIPAPDLHPFADRRPELADWLADRSREGDAIAQHGLQHVQLRRAAWPRQTIASLQGGRAAEFVGLTESETRRAVASGRRLMRLAGIEARGFVAPAYAYTRALRETVAATFDWWASLLAVHNAQAAGWWGPAVGLGTSGPLRRAASPALVRAASLCAGPLLRVDIHPADVEHPRHIRALQSLLRRARGRRAITYDQLFA